MSDAPPPEVRIETHGRLGIVVLDRPRALNALSLGMIRVIAPALDEFADDPAIDAVLIRGEGGRAFCSGGDVRAVGTVAGAEGDALRRDFFAAEYALNYRIHRFPKPFLALIDGITMGGGCGLSLHGSHRIATERTLMAMPETVLGLFPDVGATWFLNNLPGEMGVYVGLTGVRLQTNDLVALGLATHCVAAASLPDLIAALGQAERLDASAIESVLAGFAQVPGEPVVAPRRERVDSLFAGVTVEAIRDALAAASEDWAAAALDVIQRGSPTSLKLTLRQLRGGRGLPIETTLPLEYRLAVRITGGNDFREGVRSILIDKDNRPRWQPARLEEVDSAAIERLFAPLAPAEPELGLA